MKNLYMRFLLVFLLFLVFLYSLLLCIFYFKQNWYTPITEKPIPSVFGAHDAQIIRVKTLDDIELEGWFFPPSVPDKQIIVFFHGNGQHIGSSYSGIAPLRSYGYGLLMVEYRGYTGHDGVFSEDGLYIDSRAFMDWVTSQYPDTGLILFGGSMGTTAALKMATEHDEEAVIVMGSFSSVADVIQGMYPIIPVELLLKDQLRNSDMVHKVNSPIMIIHGALDRLIDVKYARKLYNGALQPKHFVLMDRAGHNDLFSYDAKDHILYFLNEHLQHKDQ